MCDEYGEVEGYNVPCCKWQAVQYQHTSRPADGSVFTFTIVTGSGFAAGPLHNLGLFRFLPFIP